MEEVVSPGKFDQEKFLSSSFVRKYWDGRVFGNTFLEDGSAKDISKLALFSLVWDCLSRPSMYSV